MPFIIKNRFAFILAVLLCFSAASFSCINTRTAEARVTLFLTMIKSGNFSDALKYVDSKPFTRSVLKKISMLPDAALLEILKLSNAPAEVKEGFLKNGGAGMSELKKSIQDIMANDPQIVEMTLKEMSTHMRDKDIDVIAQNISEITGEVHIRFSEVNAHDETIIFFVEKIGAEWKISAMEEIITGWIY
ncbi:MAG: hypothetical protein A2008_06665 [Candidatus Wallbacteria bacterium GWC2_49_35]|uniref:DUF4878 domain-containing protein n=1 Tax=Candidatus Wallbacteria bacterium GWC2_49_35 TaxID=1817813 RepID=A0A1F7WLB7_9BACT|nr:MAG: hypothetical protein A2008_06665 [Candidatus Wallbacteria bacterium GWC2_49_35]HBC76925.1 hypothetical protein [Candidatus Wallbacteria bacterium]